MTTPSAPGWYDDPDEPSQLRYFDGILWTAHTTARSSRPTGAVDEPGTAGVPPAGDGGWASPSQPAPSAGPGPAGAPPATGWQHAPGSPVGPGAPGGWGQPGMAAPAWGRRDVLPDGSILAKWWHRLVARIIDGIVTSPVSMLLAWPWLTDYLARAQRYMNDVVRAAEQGLQPPSSLDFQLESAKILVPLSIISLVVGLAYETFFLTRSGSTLGKIAMGITVRRVDRPGPLRLVEALRRQAITVGTGVLSLVPLVGTVGGMISLLDALWLLWDQRRQCLHDKVADTVVVMRPGRS